MLLETDLSLLTQSAVDCASQISDPLARLLGSWSAEINAATIFLRIILSVVLAAIIGCERSSKRHSAGLRTFILVSLASTVAMMLDLFLCDMTGIKFYMTSAASVIATAIISVNSMVFSSRNQIKGLTTSVGLWACGIIGLTAGAGYYTVTLSSFCDRIILRSILSLSARQSFRILLPPSEGSVLRLMISSLTPHTQIRDFRFIRCRYP